MDYQTLQTCQFSFLRAVIGDPHFLGFLSPEEAFARARQDPFQLVVYLNVDTPGYVHLVAADDQQYTYSACILLDPTAPDVDLVVLDFSDIYSVNFT